jgi:hypothetical protein
MKQALMMITFILMVVGVGGGAGFGYSLDGFNETGIKRLEGFQQAALGEIPGRKQPLGALLPNHLVDLRLLESPLKDLPEPDPEFTRQIKALLGTNERFYGLAVLDLSDPLNPRYAEHRGDYRQNVGSVGKIIVGVALLQALADAYPSDLEARRRILKETVVTADEFIIKDHHKVYFWNPGARALSHRKLQIGDTGSLYEFLDWMLSPSSNAAAAMCMQQAMLIKQFGPQYPISSAETADFFKATSRLDLTALYVKTFFDALAHNGIDLEQLRQGSFFTRTGKQKVPGGGNSYGTARELMRLLFKMEKGELIDSFSSRELKRLLYMTERRIRYASSPALKDSAVYFKSGSLYSCKPEPGFTCKKYQGNVKNYMNSIAIVETPAGRQRLFYMVTLISNVRYKNSALDHQTLATRIHRLMEAAHPPAPTKPGDIPEDIQFVKDLIGDPKNHQEKLQVAHIQAMLAQLGYPVGEVDGNYGSKTAGAIRAFQKDHQLEVNGNVSNSLQDALSQVIAAAPPSGAGAQ